MPDSEPIDDLLETVSRLWPGRSTKLIGRGRTAITMVGEASRASGDRHDSLLVLPDARRPRMLIPLDRHAAAASVGRYNAALEPREVLSRLAVSTALRLGGTRLFPDRIEMYGEDEGISEHLERIFGEPVFLSVTIGPPRANRKPVLGVADRRSRLLGYVKVGDTEVARGHVLGESKALALVNSVDLPLIDVPEVIWEGDWRSNYLLVMSALRAGPNLVASVRRHNPPAAAMDQLSRAFGGESRLFAETAFLRQSQRIIAELQRGDDEQRLSSCLEAVLERSGETHVRVGAWHGDFTPWNMAYQKHGRIMLWDWERFSSEGIFGLDHCHFVSQARIREAGFTEDVLSGALDDVWIADGRSPVAFVTISGYLLSLGTRYVKASQMSGGDVIRGDAQEVLAALEQWVSRDAGR